ncbi:retrovirus-related Pol polyprotein from transposon 297 [Nephila pilipes]|uniref:Retrovirus-related Pol polyprotein from transposon 297 n=1 Tax=Nephila pilipes TaxID=299642 RepID=A0A8X6NUP0_NEPPI|nr:retrovirus-related Pol polyprotein from transposon 297 [Nephila pilipes]
MEENIVEDLENLLSSFTRGDEDTMDLVKINTNEFIETKGREEPNEMKESFPCIDSNPNIFDFDKFTEQSQLKDRLNNQKIAELKEIVCRYSKIFSNEPGKTHLVEYGVEIIKDVPIKTKPYRMSSRQTV